jgi:hypothetical protein
MDSKFVKIVLTSLVCLFIAAMVGVAILGSTLSPLSFSGLVEDVYPLDLKAFNDYLKSNHGSIADILEKASDRGDKLYETYPILVLYLRKSWVDDNVEGDFFVPNVCNKLANTIWEKSYYTSDRLTPGRDALWFRLLSVPQLSNNWNLTASHEACLFHLTPDGPVMVTTPDTPVRKAETDPRQLKFIPLRP